MSKNSVDDPQTYNSCSVLEDLYEIALKNNRLNQQNVCLLDKNESWKIKGQLNKRGIPQDVSISFDYGEYENTRHLLICSNYQVLCSNMDLAIATKNAINITMY